MPTPLPATSRVDGRGLSAAASAFLLWGVLPVYLKQLQDVSIFQVTAHRLVWGCAVVVVWLVVRGELQQTWAALANPKTRLRLFASAAFISINWLMFMWAIAGDRIIEASLGYFINPLVSVLLGIVVLAERLNRAQWMAVVTAVLGVAYLTWSAGQPPWVSLTLAFSFGLYGLVRKTTQVDALPGLAGETLLLLPFGIGYLVFCEFTGTGTFIHQGVSMSLLLMLGGPFTALPLVLFAYGARRILLSTVGLLQYIGPTLQLLIGVYIYHEPFRADRAIGFVLIWTALAIYAADSVWRSRKIELLTASS